MKLLLAATIAAGAAGCSDDENERHSVRVERVSLVPTELALAPEETARLNFSVFPDNAVIETVTWSSSDPTIAAVEEGLVTAKATGTATVSVTVDGVQASCTVSVARAIAVGDYYYGDGTVSDKLDPRKLPVGVVFYTGNPAKDDPALQRDHPGCTHGLVVGLDEEAVYWQQRIGNYQATVGAWIEANAPDYISITSGMESDDNLNKIMGYNNTKAIEAFNVAPENGDWPVGIIQRIADYRRSIPAPEASSDWYLPSIKELSLLCSGPYDGNILELVNVTENLDLINEKLSAISGATIVDQFYSSSTEMDVSSVFGITSYGSFIEGSPKSLNDYMRPVLAF